MKFKIPLEGNDDEINMAPMIDMVFLLLIFFMVASQLDTMERVPVLLPVADKAIVPEEIRDRQMISILSKDNSGEIATFFVGMQALTLEEFETKIEQMATQDPNLQIYLRADRRVLHKHIQAVMKACGQAGIIDITFGTFESGN